MLPLLIGRAYPTSLPHICGASNMSVNRIQRRMELFIENQGWSKNIKICKSRYHL